MCSCLQYAELPISCAHPLKVNNRVNTLWFFIVNSRLSYLQRLPYFQRYNRYGCQHDGHNPKTDSNFWFVGTVGRAWWTSPYIPVLSKLMEVRKWSWIGVRLNSRLFHSFFVFRLYSKPVGEWPTDFLRGIHRRESVSAILYGWWWRIRQWFRQSSDCRYLPWILVPDRHCTRGSRSMHR